MSAYVKPTNARERRVLAWVNRMRKKHLGKPPLKGLPKGEACLSSAQCVIGRAFGNSPRIGPKYAVVLGPFITVGVKTLRMPQYLDDFEYDFEAGKLPHLLTKLGKELLEEKV